MSPWLLLTLTALAECSSLKHSTTSCPHLCSCSGQQSHVECSQSSLTVFPSQGLSPHTTRLSIQSTGLSNVTAQHLKTLPLLNHLQLYHNNLTYLPADLLNGVPSLVTLDLTGNKLVELPPKVFSHDFLQNLVLKNNQIEKIDVEVFSNNSSLIWLDLSGNRLTSVPSALHLKVPRLQNLDLSHNNLQENHLQDLPKILLQGLQRLELVMLNHNHLQHLPPGFLGERESSSFQVVLTGNPWMCDDKIEYLKTWLQAHPGSAIFVEEVTCSGPEGLKHRQVVSL
uniref:LRRCT domain-containing protein n=1 Tax=Cynoglossus semilaevis TaxID=244447 RepID=A0A3P8X5I8_CYNSE